MPKQYCRYFIKSLRQMFIDEQGVRDQQGPAVLSRKKPRMITVCAMTAMVVNADGKTASGRSGGKSRVAIPVLTEAVQDLNHATRRFGRRPDLNANFVAVAGLQRHAFVHRLDQSCAPYMHMPHSAIVLPYKHLILHVANLAVDISPREQR